MPQSERERIRAIRARRSALNPEPTFRRVPLVTSDFMTDVVMRALQEESAIAPVAPPPVDDEVRRCINPECGIDISDRPPQTKRCFDCSHEHHREKALADLRHERDALKSKREPRKCKDCPVDISDRHGNTVRCKDCAHKAQLSQTVESKARAS